MCGDYNLRREKRYVEVDVRFTPDGKIRPLAINYDKAHTYGIDRVLAVKHGTSRLGGKGHCFTCPICAVRSGIFGLNGASGSWKPTAPCRKAVLRNGKILIPRRSFAHSG